ncbi:MAG: cell division protein FtsI (penicillin-binding protein 3) [Parcubacteria group bacterium Licking1014_1]|nr:MAG: cell division protein FtsI (penicillin-binding protein 3) [Parcubacteria group bacterium Licking1014_1]
MKDWRVGAILFLFFIFGAAIISRLFFLQVLNHKFYQAQALGQQVGFQDAKGGRGEVFFQNSQESKGTAEKGEIKSLAINKDNWTIFAATKEIQDKSVFAEILSKNIDKPYDAMLSELKSQDSYAIIKKDLSSEELNKAKSLNLKGLYWKNNPDRYYPQERIASQVIGFLGGDGNGQYGLEGYYEDILKGKSGIKEKKRGLDLIFSNKEEIFLDGADLYLTIDYNIQFEAESLLKKAKEDLGIKTGQIIVIKPDSGRILALANFPSFNPNNYSKENDFAVFQNSVIQKLFEPGSIFKPFTMAIALNEGKITPNTTFVDTGSVKVGLETIFNFDKQKYGQRTMTEVLEKSINTGAVFVSQLIPHKTYLNYIDKFGFTEKTGIDLQGEIYSRNENLKNGPDVEFATASFGQGIEVTPIQIARGFSALANGGKLVKPYMVEKIFSGKKETDTNPQIQNQVISQQTASQITTMLINVVEKGFGSGAKIPGYYIAGKTGTAEVPFENKKGYYPDKTIQTFIGFGPALNPQFLILVKLDDPKVSQSSLSAVPVFKNLAQYIINYWKIPPDYQP